MSAKAKYSVIYRHREEYSVCEMCAFFGVSRSGYYAYTKRLSRPEHDAQLARKIQECQQQTDQTYGYRRVYLWLKKQNIHKKTENSAESHEEVWIVIRSAQAQEMGKSRTTTA